MIKYYKFGFGFVTDEVCYKIRENGMKREKAIELIKKYDGKCGDNYVRDFCKYIGISIKDFWQVVDKFVNKELFYKDSRTKTWKPKFEVGVNFCNKNIS